MDQSFAKPWNIVSGLCFSSLLLAMQSCTQKLKCNSAWNRSGLWTHLGSTCDGPNMLRKLHIEGSLADKAHSCTIARTACFKQIKTLAGLSGWAQHHRGYLYSFRAGSPKLDFGKCIPLALFFQAPFHVQGSMGCAAECIKQCS